MQFRKAVRTHLKARIALAGITGSGKTYTTLLLALTLGKRVAVIDTEHGSAAKFAGRVDRDSGLLLDFDTLELESYSPQAYIDAIRTAEREGYDVIVTDSLSHAWMGKDGALEQVDRIAARSKSGNSFTAWRTVTPQHNALVEALTGCKAHLICTLRSKSEYVITEVEKHGRTVTEPRKVGMAPIQREGIEYEFDLVGELDSDHRLTVTKSRCPELDGAIIHRPGPPLAMMFRDWLYEGTAPAPRPAEAEAPPREVARPWEAPAPAPEPAPERKRAPMRPPVQARRPAQPANDAGTQHVPRFSPQGQWPGAQRWAGKPLQNADLQTLLEYGTHIQLAIAAKAGTDHEALLRAHLEKVESVIARKEPSMQLGADPAGLGPNPPETTCEDCPTNPGCPRYRECTADVIRAQQDAAAEAG